MNTAHEIIARKLKEHSPLNDVDIGELRGLTTHSRAIAPNEDIVRKGDKPHMSVVILQGMPARYHTLRGGRLQYLSFHLTGDMPDAQSLFLERMDHAVCAVGQALIALIPHEEILRLFVRRPSVGIAIWRETL